MLETTGSLPVYMKVPKPQSEKYSIPLQCQIVDDVDN